MNTLSRRSSFLAAALVVAAVLALASSVYADTLTRQLEFGMSGSDVSTLQTFLARDSSIYPQGLVTGYFGALTKAAVINFQNRNSIAAVGRVGPITLAAINAQMNNGSADVYAPVISNINVSVSSGAATVHFTTSESAMGKVYYGTSFPNMTEVTGDAIVSGNAAMTDSSLRTTQDVTVSGLQANTTYYYVIYTKDYAGNVQMTWPATFKTNS